MANKNQNQQSKQKYGTLTATQDANNDYTNSQSSNSAGSNKQQASKSEYGTLTAKMDANKDYE